MKIYYKEEFDFIANAFNHPLPTNDTSLLKAMTMLEDKHFLNDTANMLFYYIRKCVAEDQPIDAMVAETAVGIPCEAIFSIMTDYGNYSFKPVEQATEVLKAYKRNLKRKYLDDLIKNMGDRTPEHEQDLAIDKFITQLSQIDTSPKQIKTSPELVEQYLQNEELGKKLKRLATGDDVFDSVYKGGMIIPSINVIGGISGTGKTNFACSLFTNICLKQKLNAVFYTYEMSEDLLLQRCASYYLKSDIDYLNSDSMAPFLAKMLEHQGMNMIFEPKLTIEQIYLQIQNFARQNPIHAVFLDYLTIIKTSMTFRNQWERIDHIMQVACDIGKHFNCSVFMLAQLNRTGSNKQRAGMADLKGSSGIENIADSMIMLHRDKNESGEFINNYIQASCVKMRHGFAGNQSFFYEMKEGYYGEVDQDAVKLQLAQDNKEFSFSDKY